VCQSGTYLLPIPSLNLGWGNILPCKSSIKIRSIMSKNFLSAVKARQRETAEYLANNSKGESIFDADYSLQELKKVTKATRVVFKAAESNKVARLIVETADGKFTIPASKGCSANLTSEDLITGRARIGYANELVTQDGEVIEGFMCIYTSSSSEGEEL
jgi:hypothetical protein